MIQNKNHIHLDPASDFWQSSLGPVCASLLLLWCALASPTYPPVACPEWMETRLCCFPAHVKMGCPGDLCETINSVKLNHKVQSTLWLMFEGRHKTKWSISQGKLHNLYYSPLHFHQSYVTLIKGRVLKYQNTRCTWEILKILTAIHPFFSNIT